MSFPTGFANDLHLILARNDRVRENLIGKRQSFIDEGKLVRYVGNRVRDIGSFLAGCFLVIVLLGVIPAFFSHSGLPIFSVSMIKSRFASVMHDREVLLPAELLPFREIVEEHLPWEESNLSWVLAPSTLQDALSSIPLLRSPRVKRCHWFSFSCFQILSDIREPVASVRLGEKQWLVDSGAEFLLPITENISMPSLPEIQGLEPYEHSPDRLREATARLLTIVKSFREPQQKGESVSHIHFLDEEEIRIMLSGASSPTVVITAQQLSLERLAQLGERMQVVLDLEALRGRSNAVIDLRYSGMAVVQGADPSIAG